MFKRKWSPAARAFAALGVLFGLAGFLLVRSYAGRVQALAPALGPLGPVAVAATDLSRGEALSPSMAVLRDFPQAYTPPGAVTGPGQLSGHTLLTDIKQGEVLTRSRISGEAGGPVASVVPGGLRAFVIHAPIPPGAVRQGDRVDVLATFVSGRPYSDTVVAGAEILSVVDGDEGYAFADSEGGAEGPALVLLVAPESAERLAYASASARLSVSIVGDQEVITADSTT
ncbi:MAG: Flp pilus assembly protein CpaB [Actinomycetota bacterium]